MSVLIRGARVLTLSAGDRPRRGSALRELGVLSRADVLVEGERIAAVGKTVSVIRAPDRTIDADGRVLMPGFVDCHTHACWAGDRLDEWERTLRGEAYLDILKSGGGIMSTVRAVRAAPPDELARAVRARLDEFLAQGTTSAEIKSGYGLDTATELKMLRAIRDGARGWPGTVIPTALLGHAVEGETEREKAEFVRRTIEETLPAVSREFPGIAIDAYVENGAWSCARAAELFERARALGHPVRVHADQFNALGMTAWAAAFGAVSVDHLESSTDEDLLTLARSRTFGVVLPVCGLHSGGRFARARAYVDAGGALALATNLNPGSAPSSSMPLAIATAVRRCGLTPAEAIAAATVNPAALLGLHDRGTIAPGQRADLVLLRHRDERALAYELGGNPAEAVIAGGRIVREIDHPTRAVTP